MDKLSNASSTRSGTAGLDVFKIAGRSISGFLSSWKTGDARRVRIPYTTLLELKLALFLEYHPHVRSYQRGDMSLAFANAYHIFTPLGTPYRVPYVYEEKPHEYLPDFVGTLCDGGLLIAEAGLADEKRKAQPLAKAEAAKRLAQLSGGMYWLGTDENLAECRYQSLLYLHARRQSFPTYEEIAAALLAFWHWGYMHSVDELVRRFGSRWSDMEVEAAVWKLVGDQAAQGRLLVNLTEVELSRFTPLALLDPGAPPLLPDPLPSSLEEPKNGDDTQVFSSLDEGDLITNEQGVIPGPPFDASHLSTAELQAHFHRNLSAVSEVLSGKSQASVARAYQMRPNLLSYLVKRTKELGQIACVPHGSYHRDRTFHPEFEKLLRKLYTQPLRPTIMAVYEDVQLKNLARDLSTREGKLVHTPTYQQVYDYLKSISQEVAVIEARSGLLHTPQERTSPHSFVLSIPYPAQICQVDEHTLDQLIVAADGTVLTRRVHAAVLICVKTAAILGAVLALDTLKEEDYMRLVKQTLEQKDRLVIQYECKHPWPCYGKPAVIFHDRGKIFTSERATQVLVDRLGITTQQAPPYAPSAKGTVEALFTWVTRKFSHRLPGTTKSTPKDRGAYDSGSEAEKAGMTFDLLEKLFTQAIVDGYMQEWDKLRRQTRMALWEDAVREKGVPRWMRSQDELKLLLMKAVNRKNPATGRYAVTRGSLSFLARRYVSPGLLDRLRGREIDIYYDRRDISVIYLFLEGSLVGEAYCAELMGRRMSIWEAKQEKRVDAEAARSATDSSLASRQRIQQEATASRKKRSSETKRLEQQRQMDRQRAEIHPSHVLETLGTMEPSQTLPLSLPKAEPDPQWERPVQKLAIREKGKEKNL